MKFLLITFVVTVLALPSIALAQNEENRGDGRKNAQADDRKRDGRDGNNAEARRALRVVDTNGDRQISIEEYMANAQQRFADMDTNGDNFISREEGRTAAEFMRAEQERARSLLKELRDKSNDSNN